MHYLPEGNEDLEMPLTSGREEFSQMIAFRNQHYFPAFRLVESHGVSEREIWTALWTFYDLANEPFCVGQSSKMKCLRIFSILGMVSVIIIVLFTPWEWDANLVARFMASVFFVTTYCWVLFETRLYAFRFRVKSNFIAWRLKTQEVYELMKPQKRIFQCRAQFAFIASTAFAGQLSLLFTFWLMGLPIWDRFFLSTYFILFEELVIAIICLGEQIDVGSAEHFQLSG